MPLIRHHRIDPYALLQEQTGATIYVNGVLTISPDSEFVLSSDVFNKRGIWTLFQFNALDQSSAQVTSAMFTNNSGFSLKGIQITNTKIKIILF